MAQVIAINSKGQKQVFSQMAWNLLGKNKGDWKEIQTQTVGNDAVKTTPPDMGPKKEKVKTDAELAEAEALENANKADDKYNISPEKKQQFLEEIKDLSRGAIKDFFDAQKPAVKYNNKANVVDLKTQLAEYCNYDLVKFQESFK